MWRKMEEDRRKAESDEADRKLKENDAAKTISTAVASFDAPASRATEPATPAKAKAPRIWGWSDWVYKHDVYRYTYLPS